MRDTKRRLELFSFYDHTGIEKHLGKMAASGWMLDKLGAYLWHYRRVEPKPMKFCVTYYPRASQFDPEPSEGELDFREFCERTGWKLAGSSAQLQIFRNEDPDAVPIETDPVLEIDTLHRAVKKTFLPVYFILLALGVLQVFLLIGQLVNDPIDWLSRPGGMFSGFTWIILLLILSVELIAYFRWRARAKQAAERGEFLDTPNTSPFQKVCLALVLVSFAWWMVNIILLGSSLMRYLCAAMLVTIAVLVALFNGLKNLMKRRGASKNLNRGVTFTVYFIVAFVLFDAIIFFGIWAVSSGLLDLGDQSGDPPLSVADLADVDMDGYFTRRTGDETVLLGQYEVFQHTNWNRDDPDLSLPSLEYTLTEVKLPFLYDWCRDRLYHEDDKRGEEFGYRYEATDPAPWGAQEAWERVYDDGGRTNRFLLCYEHRIVVIDFGSKRIPTPEQRAIVGEKLGQ